MANKIMLKKGRLIFDQPTNTSEEELLSGVHRILGIFWVSDEASGDDIAADDDMELVDGDGDKIISKRGEGTGDDLGITIGYPGYTVHGLKVSKLDGGQLIVWIREQF